MPLPCLYRFHRFPTALVAALLGAWAAPCLCASNATPSLPNCTFEEDCSLCFIDGIPAAQRRIEDYVAVDFREYETPWRLGRTDNDAQALFATILGVLFEEKLGYSVDYVSCGSELSCTLATNGCAGWAEETCVAVNTLEESSAAHAQGRKVFQDPVPDVMFLSATREDFLSSRYYEGSGINVNRMPSMVMGPSGYTEVYGVYAFPEDIAAVRQTHGLDVEWFEAFQASEARELLHSPAELDAFGVQSLDSESCNSSDAIVEVSMATHRAQGWVCDGAWWLNPSCAALGANWSSQCLVVVEHSWFLKAPLWQALANSGVPIAKRVLHPDSWWNVVYLGQRSVAFVWLSPAALLRHRHPVRLALRYVDEPSPEILVKVTWERALVEDIFIRLLFQGRLSSTTLESLMRTAGEARAAGKHQLNEDRFYRKLACDWLRSHEEVWEGWFARESCPQGTYFDTVEQGCYLCNLGTTGALYPNGTAYCADCPAGTRSIDPFKACEACEAGKYSNESRSWDCRGCRPGFHAASAGSTACEACAAGTVAPGRLTKECLECSAGFAALAGSAQCEACGVGFYANVSGSETCTSCGPGLVTIGRGATLPSECVCDEDTLREVGSLECVPCPDHFRCRIGSNLEDFGNGVVTQLSLRPGYMSLLEDPLQIYRCSPVLACPGTRPGVCADNRDPKSVACGLGLPNTYEDDDGFHECTSQGTDVVILVLIILACTVGLLVFAFAISRDFQDQTNAGLLVTALCSVSFSAFQTMGVFNSLSVIWFEPLKSIFAVISLASLELKYLHLGCLASVNPFTTYATRQLVAPASIPVMLLSLLLKKFSRRPVDLVPELVNVVGAVFTLFFTSIIISSATPFICYPHPNGRSSMVSETAILCFEDPEHWAMVIVGICSLVLISVPFLAVSAYGTLKYPMLLASPLERHARMLRGFRFLYLRFRPQCHFYGLVMSLRSVCICLVPVLPGLRNDSALQFCFLAAILTFFIMVQLWILPWRSMLANLADGVLMNCNLQLLVCAAVSTDFTDKNAIGKFGTAIFVSFCLLVVAGSLAAGRWYLSPKPYYNHFICHHKGGAAAQARLLKIYIQELSKSSVFIDSDDLQELDKLFDIVKTKVGKLVVYLTRETLMRPWCAGEVCTAVRARKDVTVIRTASFIPPTELELENLRSYIDLRGCNLSQYGITLEDVASAFRVLLFDSDSIERLELPDGGTSRWKAAAASLLRNGKLTVLEGATSVRGVSTASPDIGGFIISSELDDDEATASAAVVESKIRTHIMGIAEPTPLVCLADLEEEGLQPQLEQVAKARSVCVLLSAGSLSCLPQVMVMVQLMLQEGTDVIPVRLPGFQFPQESYFSRDLYRLWPGKDRKNVPEEQMRSFFKRIAVNLEIAGSDAILNREIDDIFSRVNTGKLPKRQRLDGVITTALARLQGDARRTHRLSV